MKGKTNRMLVVRNPYETLDVSPAATPDEIREAYERAIRLIRGDSLGGYLMLDDEKMDEAVAEVEAAFQQVGTHEARASYHREAGLMAVDPPGDTAAQDKSAGSKHAPSGFVSPPNTDPQDTARTPSAALLRFLTPTESGEGESVRSMEAVPEVSAEGPVVAAERQPLSHGVPQNEKALPLATRADANPSAADLLDKQARSSALTDLPTMATEEGHHPAHIDSGDPTLIDDKESSPTANKIPPNAVPPEMLEELATSNEISGSFVMRLREARGLSIEELARSTHIQKRILRAIEDVDVENLPTRVYIRGFLQQIARALRVDKKRLSEGYLAMLDRSA